MPVGSVKRGSIIGRPDNYLKGATSNMPRRVYLSAVSLMVLCGAACVGSRLPPTATPAPATASATPPGGGVHGMCGYHAARSALVRLAT